MSLGDQVDINCGGIDNIYRHHDYNIAVMESYTGKNYSNYYMHGEHLLVDGQSMSKSRGNIIYPEQLVKDGADWRDIRFFLTAVRHYREKLNYCEKNFQKAAGRIQSFRDSLKNLKGSEKGVSPAEAVSLAESIVPVFEQELDSDLSLCGAFDAVFNIIRRLDDINRSVPLSESLIKKVNNEVEKIDNVLKVIYPL
jgi:cysteinyl-tRNA synthetase